MFSYTITITIAAALDETALRDLLESQFDAHGCQTSRVRVDGAVGAPAGPRTPVEASRRST